MGTLVENAAAIKGYAEGIDDAIVAKGGTTAGGLSHAAAAIAALPSGGWTIRPWANDGKTHLWFSYGNDVPKFYAKFYAGFVSASPFTVNWGDGQTDTVASSATLTYRTLTHTYQTFGDYEVVISGYDQMTLNTYLFGSDSDFAGIPRRHIRQCEFADANSIGETSAIGICALNIKGLTNLASRAFSQCCDNLKIVDGFDDVETVNYGAFASCYNLERVGGGFDSVRTLGQNAFHLCLKLNLGELNLPVCTDILAGALSNGATFTKVSCPNLVHLGYENFHNSALTEIGDMPHLTTVDGWYAMAGKNIRTVGSLESVTTLNGSPFENIGSSLTADAEGIKTTINANQPMDTWVRITGVFPFGAPRSTKFVCTDGNIVYKSHSGTDKWTLNYSSYSAFPSSGINTYWYHDTTADKWYTWNGSAYVEVA